jgi:endonuclease YncB( thermonuclease family)
MLRCLSLFLLALVALPASAMAEEDGRVIVGRASVIDGDTIDIHGERIRLFGVDAPESGQTCSDEQGKTYRCGQRAAQALDYRISGGVVRCEPQDRNRYGRVVAICRAHGEDLSAWVVGLGWALAFRRYSERYVPAEALAKKRKLGIWRGEFTPSWDWRVRS